MKKLMILCFLFLAALPAGAWSADQDLQSKIETRLSERHPDRAEDFWNTLGVDQGQVNRMILKLLIENAATKNSMHRKIQLIEGLGFQGNADSIIYLRNELAKAENPVLKKNILMALVRSQGDDAFEVVEPHLIKGNLTFRRDLSKLIEQTSKNPRILSRVQELKMNSEKKSNGDSIRAQRSADRSGPPKSSPSSGLNKIIRSSVGTH
jgi:hypothetical protein